MSTLTIIIAFIVLVILTLLAVLGYLSHRRKVKAREEHMNRQLETMSEGFAKLKEDSQDLFDKHE